MSQANTDLLLAISILVVSIFTSINITILAFKIKKMETTLKLLSEEESSRSKS